MIETLYWSVDVRSMRALDVSLQHQWTRAKFELVVLGQEGEESDDPGVGVAEYRIWGLQSPPGPRLHTWIFRRRPSNIPYFFIFVKRRLCIKQKNPLF